MMHSLIFILIVYGTANIVVNERVFRTQIEWIKKKIPFLKNVLSCTTCLAFYIGAILFLIAPITLTGVFLLDVLLAGLLSSGAINIIEQLKIKFM